MYEQYLTHLLKSGVSRATAEPAARAMMLRYNGFAINDRQLEAINAAEIEAWATA